VENRDARSEREPVFGTRTRVRNPNARTPVQNQRSEQNLSRTNGTNPRDERASRTLGPVAKHDLLPHAQHTLAIDDEEQVDAWDGVRGQARCDDPQLALGRRSFLMERQLHAAITSGETVRVVIAPQEHDRADRRRIT
jgi:hypothetical protein